MFTSGHRKQLATRKPSVVERSLCLPDGLQACVLHMWDGDGDTQTEEDIPVRERSQDDSTESITYTGNLKWRAVWELKME